jgi:hypothetical protein
VKAKGASTASACSGEAMSTDSETKSSGIPRSAHQSSPHQRVETITALPALVRCGGSGVTFRKAHPPAQIAGRVGQPSVGRCDQDGPVGPPVIPAQAKIPTLRLRCSKIPTVRQTQGRLSRAKNAREMGHPGLSTASRGHAVVRSFGALSALLRMTRMGKENSEPTERSPHSS